MSPLKSFAQEDESLFLSVLNTSFEFEGRLRLRLFLRGLSGLEVDAPVVDWECASLGGVGMSVAASLLSSSNRM